MLSCFMNHTRKYEEREQIWDVNCDSIPKEKHRTAKQQTSCQRTLLCQLSQGLPQL